MSIVRRNTIYLNRKDDYLHCPLQSFLRGYATINLKKLEFHNAFIFGCLPYKQAEDAFSSRVIDLFWDILPQIQFQIHIKYYRISDKISTTSRMRIACLLTLCRHPPSPSDAC